MSTGGIILVALAIAVGLAGIVVPILPGGLLVIAAIGVWAFVESTTVSWVTFGVAAAVFVAAEIIKYTWPVKRLRQAQVRTSVLVIGALAGIVGFFVIPVIGLLIGFVAGVFGAELAHPPRPHQGVGLHRARPQRRRAVRRRGVDGRAAGHDRVGDRGLGHSRLSLVR